MTNADALALCNVGRAELVGRAEGRHGRVPKTVPFLLVLPGHTAFQFHMHMACDGWRLRRKCFGRLPHTVTARLAPSAGGVET